MQRTEKAIEIDASIERVFELFSDFENFPRWMKNIKDVHYTGRRFSRWTARAPLGTSVEWEAETTVFEPGRKICWRTVRGDVNTSGEVDFEATRRGTTTLRVMLGYEVPAGRLGALVASLFNRNPEQELEEDLLHFAKIAEGGDEQQHEEQQALEPHRHALTPRERAREIEMDRERRLQNVPEESRKIFRRGADRLMDEGPSTRWRKD